MRHFGLAALLLASPAPASFAPDSPAPDSLARAKDGGPRSPIDPVTTVPVFADDIIDRRYIVLGVVTVGVRKPTLFSKASFEAKIYRELWERAEKMGADAVVHARYGNSHISALSWGKTNGSGVAVRFVPAEKE